MVYHLAQLNVARMKGVSIEDPEMKDFRDNTDRVNELAEATPVTNALNDEQVLINFSVWEDVASLREFTYKTFHSAIMKRQKEWFQKYGTAHYVLWWIKAGTTPTVQEGLEKLKFLQKHGASKEAFTYKEVYEKSE